MMVGDDKFYRARITKREEFAPDLWMIRIEPGGEFKFAPGQYATLGVEHDGKRIERPYSIVSAPFENEIEFFFELVPEGALTPRLFKLQPGDELLMRKVAKGKCTLDTESGRKHHLLVCTVTGVAPFVSFIRQLAKDWKEGRFDGGHQLYLLNGASRPWEFGYKEELIRFDAELPWFKYVPYREPAVGSCRLAGRDRPRRRCAAQIRRSLGTRRHKYNRILVWTPGHDREQQSDPKAARLCR